MNYNKAVFEAAYGTSKQLPKDAVRCRLKCHNERNPSP